MSKTIKNKVVIHLPHKAWVDNQFIDINYSNCRENLLAFLQEFNINGFYITNVLGFYKNRSYNEELITLFYEKINKNFKNLLIDWAKEWKIKLYQEAFAIEFNDTLKII